MGRRAFVAMATGLTAMAWLTAAGPAEAAEITLRCTNGMRAVVLELAPAFERVTGHKVTVTFAASNVLAERIKRGETADLAILTSESLDEVTTLGLVVAGSRVDLARSGVGVAVAAGKPKPDIGSVEALKRALLTATSIAYSTGGSGVHVARLLERFGIAEEVKAKTRLVSGEPVGAVLARGEAELGFQQISELLPEPGIQFVGPLPAETQNMTLYSAALLTGAKEPDAARALVQFLAAPAARPVITMKGMEPN